VKAILDGMMLTERRAIKEVIRSNIAKLMGDSDQGEVSALLSGSKGGNGLDAKALQNRDRSRASYLSQMKKIADNPDYDRVSTSKTPDTGAPMVFVRGVVIPKTQTGKKETITMADGKGGTVKIPAIYAVIEAKKIIASHTSSGDTVKEYGGKTGIMALNNGRSAALKKAYSQGTASGYRDALLENTQEHGVSLKAIEGLKEPVLVRVFSESSLDGVKDAGAASNVSAGASLSSTEQAESDSKKINNETLSKYAGGDINAAQNREFVSSFIDSLGGIDANGDMLTAEGFVSASGINRIEAAMVSKAFGDSATLADLSESPDSDLKSLGNALKDISGRWAVMVDMAKSGAISRSMDVTKQLNEAVAIVRKSRQTNTKVSDLVAQDDIFSGSTDPVAKSLINLMYRDGGSGRIRSAANIQKALHAFIDQAMATTDGADMFGYEADPKELMEQQKAALEAEEVTPQTSLFDSIAGLFNSWSEALNKAEFINMIFDSTINKAAKQVNTNPTEGQIEAGNYAKGKVSIQGLRVVIENPKGSTRSGVNKDGKRWESKMKAHYGYFSSTEGNDGDEVDVFLGDLAESASPKIFVVNQVDEKGKFDEHKVMFGYKDLAAAKAGYLENYEAGWRGLGSIKEIALDKFKEWVHSTGTKQILDSASGEMGIVERMRIKGLIRSGIAALSDDSIGIAERLKVKASLRANIALLGGRPISADPYEAYKANISAAEMRLKAASSAMHKFPKLANGLTPDDIKRTTEFREKKLEKDLAFEAVRKINIATPNELKKRATEERREAKIAKLNSEKPLINMENLPNIGDDYNKPENKKLDAKEIAKKLRKRFRDAIKSGDLPKGVNFSIKISRYSGGQSINLRIKKIPNSMKLLNDEYVLWQDTKVDQPPIVPERFTKETENLIEFFKSHIQSFNFDKSGPMTDYYNVNFYSDVSVEYGLVREKTAEQLAALKGEGSVPISEPLYGKGVDSSQAASLALKTLDDLSGFMPKHQMQIVRESLQGGGLDFVEVVNRLKKIISTMPKLNENGDMGDDAVAHLHYFYSSGDWWITEREDGKDQNTAFGIASMNGMPLELGYIDIVNKLDDPRIELDFHFKPQRIGDIKDPIAREAATSPDPQDQPKTEEEEAVATLESIVNGDWDERDMEDIETALFGAAEKLESLGLEEAHSDLLGNAAVKYESIDRARNG